jgi:hypothetical protein
MPNFEFYSCSSSQHYHPKPDPIFGTKNHHGSPISIAISYPKHSQNIRAHCEAFVPAFNYTHTFANFQSNERGFISSIFESKYYILSISVTVFKPNFSTESSTYF